MSERSYRDSILRSNYSRVGRIAGERILNGCSLISVSLARRLNNRQNHLYISEVRAIANNDVDRVRLRSYIICYNIALSSIVGLTIDGSSCCSRIRLNRDSSVLSRRNSQLCTAVHLAPVSPCAVVNLSAIVSIEVKLRVDSLSGNSDLSYINTGLVLIRKSRCAILLLEVESKSSLLSAVGKRNGIVSEYRSKSQVGVRNSNLVTRLVAVCTVSPCSQSLACSIESAVQWNGVSRANFFLLGIRYNAFGSSRAKVESDVHLILKLRRVGSLNSEVRSIVTTGNSKGGSLRALVIARDDVGFLVLVIACPGVGVHSGNSLIFGVHHLDITTPGAGSHGNLYRSCHGDSSLEVSPTMLIRVELATKHGNSISSVFGNARYRTVIGNGNTKLKGSLVGNLVSGQQVAVGKVNLEVLD